MRMLSVLFALSLPGAPAFAAEDANSYRSASMETVYASGFYEPTRGGVLALNFSNETPESMTLSVSGRKLTARIWRISPSRCGNRFYARLFVPDNNTATDLVLTDYTAVRCRLYVRESWHLNVTTREPDGSESRLEMVGNPELEINLP